MLAEITATVDNGILRPDSALPFPDKTRVKVTIEPVESQGDALAAWKRLITLIDEHPVTGLAGKFTRDELYERD